MRSGCARQRYGIVKSLALVRTNTFKDGVSISGSSILSLNSHRYYETRVDGNEESELLYDSSFEEGCYSDIENNREREPKPQTLDGAVALAEKCTERCQGGKEGEECLATSSHLWWCNICTIMFCERCWSGEAAHRNTTVRVRHEKTAPRIRDMIDSLMPSSFGDLNGMHRRNQASKWFGVEIDAEALGISTRYTELCYKNQLRKDQYPVLISFVGDTGAGKSSLISSLMKVVVH